MLAPHRRALLLTGDDFVDWVSVRVYDLPTYTNEERVALADAIEPSMTEIRAFAPQKPFMIAKTGVDTLNVASSVDGEGLST
jgi:hypothetical protein